MQHITGIPRNQMVFTSLEDTILPENPRYANVSDLAPIKNNHTYDKQL